MTKQTLTYAVAMSAGRDAANARMRSEGRTTWNQEDYESAAREFNRIMGDAL